MQPVNVFGCVVQAQLDQLDRMFWLMKKSVRLVFTLVILVLVIIAEGCAKKYIPNTTIVDTPFNKRVIKFCEQYRLAVESKNIGKLLMLASPDYFENGGTTDKSDDFDYSRLADVLKDRFAKIKTIRYDIKYRRISREGKLINVDYTWRGSFLVKGSDGQDYWFRKVEDNRLVLVEYKDTFKILGGM